MWEFVSIGLVGILSSFLGTLVGGGALVMLPALMLMGVSVHAGIASTKFATACGSFSGVSYLWKTKQLPTKDIVLYAGFGLAGGVCGAFATASVSDAAMKSTAIVLLVSALAVTFMNRGVWNSEPSGDPVPPSWRSRIVTWLIAVYDGGFGPGSTTFGILHFMRRRWSYAKAVQLTRVVILGSNLGAFAVFYQTGFIEWTYALPLAAGHMIGSRLGFYALPKVPLKLARVLLISVVIALIASLSYDLASTMI